MDSEIDFLTNESRKRREFLYHIYACAYYESQSLFGKGWAANMLSVCQSMDRNWAGKVRGNEGVSLLVHYHLLEGNISITTPNPDPIDREGLKAYAGPPGVWVGYVYITPKGRREVENDQELLSCIGVGGVVNWSAAVTRQSDTGDGGEGQTAVSDGRDWLTEASGVTARKWGMQAKRVERWRRIVKNHMPNGRTQQQIAESENMSLEAIKADYRDMRNKGLIT